jgi:hypothetical protein
LGLQTEHFRLGVGLRPEGPILTAQVFDRSVLPIVHLLDRVYETGVRLTKSAFRPIVDRLERSLTVPKWILVIQPTTG